MKKSIFLMAAVSLYSQLLAQTDSSTILDPVVVTATKTEIKQSQTGKVITVVGQDILKHQEGRSFSELLNEQVGIYIAGSSNSKGMNQDMYFRGAPIGSVLLLLDGVPLQDPSLSSGTFDLNLISIAQIERIEILRGAQSTLWGSEAVAGVINIITKKQSGKRMEGHANLSAGSFHTYKGNVGFYGKMNQFTYQANYQYLTAKGFSSAYDSTNKAHFDKDGINQHNAQLNFQYHVKPNLQIQLNNQWGKYKADADAGAFVDDTDFTASSENWSSSLFIKHKEKKLSLQFSHTLSQIKRTYFDDSLYVPHFAYSKWSLGEYNGNISNTDLYGNYTFNPKWNVLLGVQFLQQSTEQFYESISDFGNYRTELAQEDATMKNISVYTSASFSDLKKWNVEVGARYNHHNVYGFNGTFSFNPSYLIDSSTKLFLNISSAYKVPSLYQLYGEFGNTHLKPEESINYELGVDWIWNNKQNYFRVLAFKRNIRDLIIFYTNPTDFSSTYLNRDKQKDFGFELEAKIKVAQNGSWSNVITYVDGQGEVGDETINNLYRRPNFVFNSQFSFSPIKSLTLIPSFRWVGRRLPSAYDPNDNSLSYYHTLNLYSSYQISKSFLGYIDLKNITNQKYFDMPGYNSSRFNLMMGLQFKF